MLAGRPNINPEYVAYVEVRDDIVFFYDTVIEGPRGLPFGSEEPALTLYSGGFNSTVAWWLIRRRGSPADAVFFDVGVDEAKVVLVEATRSLASERAY